MLNHLLAIKLKFTNNPINRIIIVKSQANLLVNLISKFFIKFNLKILT